MKTNAERQKLFKERRAKEGKKRIEFWLYDEETARVKNYIKQIRKNKLLVSVHSGKVLTTSNGNEALWEKHWKWTEQNGYQSVVCAPGIFDNWRTYKSEEEFLKDLMDNYS